MTVDPTEPNAPTAYGMKLSRSAFGTFHRAYKQDRLAATVRLGDERDAQPGEMLLFFTASGWRLVSKAIVRAQHQRSVETVHEVLDIHDALHGTDNTEGLLDALRLYYDDVSRGTMATVYVYKPTSVVNDYA